MDGTIKHHHDLGKPDQKDKHQCSLSELQFFRCKFTSWSNCEKQEVKKGTIAMVGVDKQHGSKNRVHVICSGKWGKSRLFTEGGEYVQRRVEEGKALIIRMLEKLTRNHPIISRNITHATLCINIHIWFYLTFLIVFLKMT